MIFVPAARALYETVLRELGTAADEVVFAKAEDLFERSIRSQLIKDGKPCSTFPKEQIAKHFRKHIQHPYVSALDAVTTCGVLCSALKENMLRRGLDGVGLDVSHKHLEQYVMLVKTRAQLEHRVTITRPF